MSFFISFRSKVNQQLNFSLEISDPLMSRHINETPEKARFCVKPRRLSHRAFLCDARFGRHAIATEFCTFVEVLNAVKRANFGGFM
jgi:hypothetical protein